MKIGLLGYGKMGKAVEAASPFEIVSRITSKEHISTESLSVADVWIEFTHPEAVVKHIHKVIASGKPIVVGTTGWNHRLSEIKTLVEENQGSLLYSPNFSIGLQIFRKIVEEAAELVNGQYDIGIIESHHRHKADKPSGTAAALAELIRQKTNESSVDIASLRCGSELGQHTIVMDSPFDKIELQYQAKNREIYAHGALRAAEWLMKHKGFHTFEEVVFRDDF